ncbi:MAG: hypothetical protein OEY88_09325 [Candidatus Bathyarchaeota archaeon]|nr:hypothetical protein [Candidatus Bathyarchaeota archaeon]
MDDEERRLFKAHESAHWKEAGKMALTISQRWMELGSSERESKEIYDKASLRVLS